MTTVRRKKKMRGQETQETTTTRVMTTVTTCPCVCDNDHNYLRRVRLTTTQEMTAPGKGALRQP